MPSHLVIVESPTKAKTIKRFLGKDFDVEASMGHVRDLPTSTLAVDTENFTAKYVVPKEKLSVVKKLQKALDGAKDLWIATDSDREGEAIGWHLLEVLKRKHKQTVKRIVFHEITREAIEEAVAHPRELDVKLVDAQHARRILDRLVGYTLSPFLWKKVYRGLSAGRVQSVAVRIIVDREREIQAFKPQEYWTIRADLLTKKKEPFAADLKALKGEKFIPRTQAEADRVLSDLKGASYSVSNVEEKELKKTPPPPFTTSTLQQEAGRKLGYSVKQTMVVAQQLYEGIDLGKGEGHAGLITYMRTDSVNMSDKSLAECKETIAKHFGREYILSAPRRYKTKSKGAQEAHEAIHPTEASRIPESLKDVLDSQQLKLYTLIWERAIATQMAAAELKRVGADIAACPAPERNATGAGAGEYTFRATGQTILFDGYLRVYLEGRDEPEQRNGNAEEEMEGEKTLPPLKTGDPLSCKNLLPEQHFTKPPPRYTEASLVKKLEEEGIGRPSTYAPTISTIQQRGYIKKEGRQLQPEEVAFTVTDLLTEHFPDIVDLAFTAKMEDSLDDIAEDKLKYLSFLRGFYKPFHELVQSKNVEVQKDEVLKDRSLGIDPETKLEVLARTGRFGPYVQLGRIVLKPGEKPRKLPKPKCASIPKTVSKDAITLSQALSLLAFPRVLGEKDGSALEVHLGRFGPYIKWGEVTATLSKDLDPARITKEEAIIFLTLSKERKAQAAEPLKSLGSDPATGAQVQVKTGRYGPYVTDGKTNASLPKKFTPETITLEDAADLLAKKRARGPSKWKGRWKKRG